MAMKVIERTTRMICFLTTIQCIYLTRLWWIPDCSII